MGLIRLVLALAVVFGHAGQPFPMLNAGLAVQAFFIISGFYMSLILSTRYNSASLFYSNRLIRIFPSYLLVLAVTLVFTAINSSNYSLSWVTLTTLPNPETATYLVITNVIIIGQDIICWFGVDPSGALTSTLNGDGIIPAWKFLLVPQAWSISLELMFYALAPLLVKCRTRTLIMLAIASLALRPVGGMFDLSYWLWPRRFFPAEFSLFLFGMLAHRAMPNIRFYSERTRWVALAGTVTFLLVQPHLHWDARLTWGMTYVCVAVALPFLFVGFGRSTVDRTIGELSYPVYLTHILVIAIVDALAIEWRITTIVVVTLALSSAIFWTVDRPLAAFRGNRVPVQV